MPETNIESSVGRAGKNRREDVVVVQMLLNEHRAAKMGVDGNCGPRTIAAIVYFQSGFLKKPDGRIDPGGLSWRKLLRVANVAEIAEFVQLSQFSGGGYYPYSSGNRQWGTLATIQALQEVAATFKTNMPAVEM
ncbi:MAG: hypothetical protein ABJA82_04625 [Myxococcales bacterium]